MNRTQKIQEACAWVYQKVAAVLLNWEQLPEDTEIKILDILSAIASGDDFEVPE